MPRYSRSAFRRVPRVIRRKLVVFASTGFGTFGVQLVTPEERAEQNRLNDLSDPTQNEITLVVPLMYGDTEIYLDLTAMTELELEAVRIVFNKALDLATPIAREQDKYVKAKAEQEPDVFFTRLTRPLPRVFTAPRIESEHSGELSPGYPDVPE